MKKSILICSLACCLVCIKGSTQTLTQLSATGYTYYPPTQDKLSWQRSNLWMAAIFYRTNTSGLSMDSGVIYASHSLGLSRLTIAAEGIDDPNLIAQSKWFDERSPGKAIQLLKQAKGKDHLKQLILLGSYYVFESDNLQRQKDSSEYFLKKAISESRAMGEIKLRRVATILLAKFYAESGERTIADSIFGQLIHESETAKDKAITARALAYRGLYTIRQKDILHSAASYTEILQLRAEYLTKAAEIYHSINDIENEIVALMNLGYFHMMLSQFDDSYNDFVKMLELENSIGYPYTHYTTHNIGLMGQVRSKFGEPLKYARETAKRAETTLDSIAWAIFYSTLSTLTHIDNDKKQESLEWMLKALDRHIMAKSPGSYSVLYNIVTVMNEMSGRQQEALNLALKVSKKIPTPQPDHVILSKLSFAICYLGLHQYKLAEQYALAADSVVKQYTYQSAYTVYKGKMINNTLADIYFEEGQYTKAKKYLEDILADSNRVEDVENEMAIYQQLIFIDSVFNNAPSAVKHYKQYMQLMDSNFRASKIRQAEELDVMYQTREKQDSIYLLNGQAKFEKATARQAVLVKNVTIAGIIGALIIALLLYRLARLRKKNNGIITHKNDQLEYLLTEKDSLLTEKDWLLKEIHHRVKNNLQIVMSLLNSQTEYIEDGAALTAINDSQHRVHAMSLIHQKLYGSEDISSIEMDVYIRELVSYLDESFNKGSRIHFEFDIEPLKLDVSQAVPLGLILNEAITNSIKYAFPREKSGVIAIMLTSISPQHYLLRISDNGVGMPADFKNQDTLGMSMMEALSENLEGEFVIENSKGTTVKISFLRNTSVKRHEFI